MDREHSFVALSVVLDQVDAAIGGVDVGLLSGVEPVRVLERLAGTERRLAALRTRVAQRGTQTTAWAGRSRSPEAWVADTCGTTLADAKRTIETGEQLDSLPQIADAFDTGQVSEAQARQIAGLGDGAKGHEGELIRKAQSGTQRQLKNQCDRLAAQQRSREDESKRLERQQRRRSARWYKNNNDADVLEVAFGPQGAVLARAHVEAEVDAIYRIARAEGRHEPRHAYTADAVTNLLCGRTVDGTPLPTKASPATKAVCATAPSPHSDGGTDPDAAASTVRGEPGRHLRCQPTVTFICDIASFRAGEVLAGERCEIDGVGPVPVELVERFLTDAFVKCVITDGTEIRTVVHYGRHIPTELETALNLRDPHCAVPGCDSRLGLEYTHNNTDHAHGGAVSFANIRRKCGYHHQKETNHDHTLTTNTHGTSWNDRNGRTISHEPAPLPQLE